MAINQDVQDLDNFPGTVKRVTLDVSQLVPVGTNGDEKLMMVASTSSYSDVEARTSIQDLYAMDAKIGWTKSTGLEGSAGKFALSNTSYKLGVKLDATVSGTYSYDTENYYEISLDYNTDSTPKSGEDIAIDLQGKIRSIVCGPQDVGFQLAYKNSDVEFKSGKFYISSGTIANSYIGSLGSSARVAPAMTDDCSELLGFKHQVTSEDVAGQSVAEAKLMVDYVADTTELVVSLGTGIQTGDSFHITDGEPSKYDYCTALNVVDTTTTTITVPTNGVNSYIGISNSYTTASGGAIIQVLRKQDPDVSPNNYWADMDELFRYMTKSVINQIDFSG